MKKICFLSTLLLLSLSSFGITVTVNATGAAGSFKTGMTTAAARTDGNMIVNPTTRRGWAVFDLAGVLPAGSTVSAVNVRFNFSTSTGSTAVGCGIYGYAGDLSTVTLPATLFPDCILPPAFNTTNWGAAVGGAQDNLPFNAAGNTFIQTNAATKVSICFSTTGAGNVYTITGEGGTLATQPELQITYTCTGVSGVTASANPNPACVGTPFTLVGGGTGTTTYLWTGPAGFTSTLLNPPATSAVPGTFIYTFTATSAAGCGTTVTSTPVVVNALPAPISGPSSVCASGGTITLTDPSGLGTWASSATAVATAGTSTGVITGVISGTTTVTYTNALTGCTATAPITVNPAPLPITGPVNVCVGSTITLADATPGGTWSSTIPGQATVGSTGIVTGLAAGTPSILYTQGICPATLILSVNAPPVPITGVFRACPGTSTTLSEASTGGTWSSSSTAIATVGSATGVVHGVSAGIVTITYANGCGPNMIATVTINPLPSPITGFNLICVTSTTTLVDTSAGGAWSSTPTAIATVGTSGVVSGVALGPATVTYTYPATGCYVTRPVTVNPAPAPITSVDSVVCQNSHITYSDAIPGGIWTSSNTSIATTAVGGIVTGASMGIAIITYTTGASCFLTRPVTVNPWAPILGRDSVCIGLSTYLTDIVGGGTWSSTNTLVATVRIDSGRVFGMDTGKTKIIYLLPTGCTDTVTFRVVSFPVGTTGIDHVCPGANITLHNASAGGTWSSSNPTAAIVGSNSGVVTGGFADTVDIIYSLPPGCSVHYIVTVNPLPDPIFGVSVMCPGNIDSVFDFTPGGTWSSGTPTLATIVDSSGVLTSLLGGSAIISYTLPTGCARTKTVTIRPAPHPVVTYNWIETTFFTPDIWVTYQWYDSATGLLPGATHPTLAAQYTEYYFVSVTDTLGCTGISDTIHYRYEEAGVKSLPGSGQVKIYPNPATGMLHIASAGKVRVVISGIEGKAIIDEEVVSDIDISELPVGTYLVGLYDHDGKLLSVQKLVKE